MRRRLLVGCDFRSGGRGWGARVGTRELRGRLVRGGRLRVGPMRAGRGRGVAAMCVRCLGFGLTGRGGLIGRDLQRNGGEMCLQRREIRLDSPAQNERHGGGLAQGREDVAEDPHQCGEASRLGFGQGGVS